MVFAWRSPAEDPGEDEGSDDGGVGFDDVFGGVDAEFAPGDFFIRDGTGVGAEAGGGVADLAEVGPEGDVVPFEVLIHHGDDADGEVSGDAASDLEESDAFTGAVGAVPIGQPDHVFDAAFHGGGAEFVFDDVGGEDVAHGGVFPAANDDREIFLGGSDHPGVFGIDFVVGFEDSRLNHLEHEFVGEKTLPVGIGGFPELEDMFLEAAKGFFFGDAGVGDPVETTFEEFPFVLGGEIAVAWNAAVVGVGDEVHEVFLEVGSGAGDDGDFVLADHFGEGDAEFGGAHGPGEGDHHFSAFGEMTFVALGGIDEGGGVEMAVVVLDKLGDGTSVHGRKLVEVR